MSKKHQLPKKYRRIDATKTAKHKLGPLMDYGVGVGVSLGLGVGVGDMDGVSLGVTDRVGVIEGDGVGEPVSHAPGVAMVWPLSTLMQYGWSVVRS